MESVVRTSNLFTIPDFCAFIVMLLICIGIGLYFGFVRTTKTVSDYLVGGRSLSVFPVAISLVVTNISGIALLGYPTEIYLYGSQYVYEVFAFVIVSPLALRIFLPIFMELNITSTNEYLLLRFGESIRRLGSILFMFAIILWIPIVVYVPAIAFSHAAGVNVHLTTIVISTICVFYTTIGGIRAVIWTDLLQAFFMIFSLLAVLIQGILNVGGLSEVFQKNLQGDRIIPPNFEINPFTRLTFWGLTLGSSIGFIQSGVINQVMMQRYVSLPSLKHAKRAYYIFVILQNFFFLTCCFAGFVIYATYHACDPITSKKIDAPDQLLPLLVIDTLGHIPGFSGLFMAGIFSASLSSLSSALNSMAAVVLEDCYKPMFPNPSAFRANLVVKTTVVVVGIIGVLFVFIVQHLGPVLQISAMVWSVTSGPLFGIYLMGVLIPMANKKGALWGGICGLCVVAYINFSTQAALASGIIKNVRKPLSTAGCGFNSTIEVVTTIAPMVTFDEEVFNFFKLSYLWYYPIGMLVTVILGVAISYMTGGNKIHDPKLYAPFIRKYLPVNIELGTGKNYELEQLNSNHKPEVAKSNET